MALRSPAPHAVAAADSTLRAIEQNRVAAGLVGLTALAALALLVFTGLRVVRVLRRRKTRPEDVLTFLAAGIASGVAAQGMWVFFRDNLDMPVYMRILFSSFLEIMVLTSALRARSSMRENYSAGVDGVAMWVLTCLSAVLSATDAHNTGTVLVRLCAPLVAAWGWERGMRVERRRRTGKSQINLRFSLERVLVRLGLADPTDRTTSQVAAERRLTNLALAAYDARTHRAAVAGTGKEAEKASKEADRASRRMQKALRAAVAHGALGTGPEQHETLLGQLSVLYSGDELIGLQLPSAWTSVLPPAAPDQAPEPDDHQAPYEEQTVQDPPGISELGEPPQVSPVPAAEPEPASAPTAGVGRAAEPAGAAELGEPAGDGGDEAEQRKGKSEIVEKFKEALTRHSGKVPAARRDLEQARIVPPSVSYAYTLQKQWKEEQQAQPDRLKVVSSRP